jgi:chromosome segregation ATPase
MTVKHQKEDFSDLVNYVDRVTFRINELGVQSKDISKQVSERDTELQREVSRIKADIKIIKKNINIVKELIEKQKKLMNQFSGDFKGLAKKEELERLKDKIDAWGPETFITRRDLKNI